MMCADTASSSPRAAALRAFLCALKGGLEQHTNALFRLGYSVEAFLASGRGKTCFNAYLDMVRYQCPDTTKERPFLVTLL